MVNATFSILSEEGASVLLRGLGPTVVGYGLEGAAKFGIYEGLKKPIFEFLPTDDQTLPYLLASGIAGGVAAIILCPIEVSCLSCDVRMIKKNEFFTP